MSRHTIEEYKELGAYTRLAKSIVTRAEVSAKIVPFHVQIKLKKASELLFEFSDYAEECMLHNCYGTTGQEYLTVFYGDISINPRNSIDEEVIKKAQGIFGDLFIQNRWISVKDSLPGENDIVLTSREDDVILLNLIIDGRWLKSNNTVTHWLPIPKPPELQNEN